MKAEIVELSLRIVEYYSKIMDSLKYGLSDVAFSEELITVEKGISTLKDAVTKLAALSRARGAKQPSLPAEVLGLDFEALNVELQSFADRRFDNIFEYVKKNEPFQYKNINGHNSLGYNDKAAALNIEAQDKFCIAADNVAVCIRLMKEYSQPSSTPPPAPAPAKEKQPPHFNCSFDPNEQGTLFANLKNGGFLPKTTPYSHFCYVFGQTPIPDNEAPFKPLEWKGMLDDLVYFIVNVVVDADCKSLWEATASHFVYNGNPPNKNTMKTMANKNKNYYNNKDKLKRHEKIRAATSY